MSSGVPHWCTLPSLMTAMRSDIVSASSWSCVTKTNVMPTSRWMRLSSTCIALRSLRSNAASGSSSSSTEGRLTSARARATRCRWPPDNALGLSLSRPVSWTSSSISPTRRVVSVFPTLRRRSPNATFLPDRQVVEERVALEDGVDVAPVRRQVGDVLAVQRHFAIARVDEAADHPQCRGLTAPGRAEQREELARRDVEVQLPDGGALTIRLRDAAQ